MTFMQTTLQFVMRLMGAVLLGALVGLERQWRQRMAGTWTTRPPHRFD